MDRLEEANKVTSLMRRRENPRHISAARLMCNSAQERRGFFEPKQAAPRTDTSGFTPALRGPASPRVSGVGDRYVPPSATRLSGPSSSRRADASRIRINGRGTLPSIPPRRQTLLVQISQAPIVLLHCDTPAPKAGPRDFGMLRQREIRVHVGHAAIVRKALGPPRELALQHLPRLRKINSAANEGNALRVSIGIGFRVPAVNWRALSSLPPSHAALVWPRTPRRVLPERRDSDAACRNLEIGITKWRMRLPEVANGGRPARFIFPGTLAPRNRRPVHGSPASKRATDVSWKPSEPRSRAMAVLPPAAGFAARNGAHLFTINVTPSTARSVQHVAFSAFIPQDPVGCPKVTFEGTVAAAIAGAPVPGGAGHESLEPAAPQLVPSPATPVVVRIEEHFGSGWDNWVGGMKDWLVDVAGVRTGSLALFVPTLELIDYDLDFLARIDTRSLTWVVRAAGFDEFLRCTLTAVGGGELEFTRCAVISGVEQTPVIAAQRVPGKPRSAMTVSTRVSGDSFTVSVDGKNVDAWDDDRFPMGGIGFTGAPDDRARLYWVRLSSTELTAKEYQNK